MYFRNKHRLAMLAAAIATWLSVAAGPVSADDKVFDVVAPFEIGGLDPAISGFVFQRMQITETLLESDAKGQPLPALAERWSVSDDGKELRLTIRQGVKFHDGSALTAEVAAHSLSAANTRTGMLRSAKIDAITADDNDVVIRLAEPFKPLTAVLAHSSTNILATAAYDAEDNVQSVIGTGPYRLTLLEPPQRLAAECFENYWGEKPSIEKTTYLGAGRGETRSLMAESNGAELVFQLDPPSIARLKRSKHVKVLMGPVPRVVVLAANAGSGATAPVEVRKAISLAIQREGIAAAVLRAPGTGATQMFADSVPAWHDERLPALAYDPDAARTLLEAQGWTPGADGTLQLALYGRNYALVPDPLVTLLADFGNGGAEWGPLGWDNPQFEQTMSTLLASDDPAEQQRLRNQIVALIQHDLPLIPIAWYRQSIAVSNAVDNAAIDPFERTFGLSTMRWVE